MNTSGYWVFSKALSNWCSWNVVNVVRDLQWEIRIENLQKLKLGSMEAGEQTSWSYEACQGPRQVPSLQDRGWARPGSRGALWSPPWSLSTPARGRIPTTPQTAPFHFLAVCRSLLHKYLIEFWFKLRLFVFKKNTKIVQLCDMRG